MLAQVGPAEAQHEVPNMFKCLASGHIAVDGARGLPWMQGWEEDEGHGAVRQVQGAVLAPHSEEGG